MSPVRTDSDYDITIVNGSTTTGIMFARRPNQPFVVGGAHTPREAGQQGAFPREVPVRMDDWSAGAFHSQRWAKNGYSYAVNGYTRSPRMFLPAGYVTSMTVPSGVGAIYSSVEYGGHLYFFGGQYALKLTSGTSQPAIDRDFGASYTAESAVIFNNAIYVGGSGGNLQRYNGSWSTATFGRRFLATVYWVLSGTGSTGGGGGFRLIGTNSQTSFHHVSGDPMTEGNWTSATQVGGTGYDINGVVSSNRHVYFLRPDGVYDIDGRGYSPNLTPYWQHNTTSSDHSQGLYHDGYVYAPHIQGLDRVDVSSGARQDVPGWCSPGFGMPNETPIAGRVTAIVADNGWVCVAVFNGTSSYICYGKDRSAMGIQGPGPMVWHGAEYVATGEKITHLRVSSPGGQPRLWMASIESSGVSPAVRLRWMSLPKGGNPYTDYLNGGSHRFAEDFSIYLPWEDWDDGSAKKRVMRFEVAGDHMDASHFFDVYASADRAAYELQGHANVSPMSEFTPTDDLITGYSIGLRVNGQATPTVPTVLRSLKTLADVTVTQTEVVKFPTCIIGDEIRNRRGACDTRGLDAVWSEITDLQYAGKVTLTDHRGQSFPVIVEQGIEYEDREDPDHGFHRVFSLSCRKINSSTVYWDSGYLWDDGHEWG